jgi:ribosomal protein L12E/L44/L45/RPP1/RPP2
VDARIAGYRDAVSDASLDLEAQVCRIDPDDHAHLKQILGTLPEPNLSTLQQAAKEAAAAAAAQEAQEAQEAQAAKAATPNKKRKLRGGSVEAALSPVARLSMSSTTLERQARAIKALLASGGVGERLISSMISSTLDSATARPSWMCALRRASRSSYTVRRVTTSRRWARRSNCACCAAARRAS